ncbi:AAA family ATPase [Stutzerimonas kunmingensis]|uniref:AAA family ATPase n=1 Tax=Stutzerimonas kunmingensis TaxID=1211807 RepID=UPI000CE30004|nr:AAA family ATPase [Stutzerimonas kunmingensis]
MHIALFGIAGAGKSTLTQELVSTNPQYVGLSASTLLKKAGRPVEIFEIERKSLLANQQHLIRAYASLKSSNKNTIVEFHAVIETNDAEFWVPIEILKQLEPDLIFFIIANPIDVYYRRIQEKSNKNRRIISEIEISELQSMALLHVTKAYSKDKITITSNSNAFRVISEVINKDRHSEND